MAKFVLPSLLGVLVAVWIGMLALGTGPVDEAVLAFLYSGDQPDFRLAAQAITLIGEWQSMLGLVAAAALWLLYRRRVRAALLFVAVTLSGRLLILLQKESAGRMRPDGEEHLVVVRSLSFPSAHTANSMIVFLALAVFAAPERHRRAAVMLALFATLVVGLSRPMLGVHWPSDVIGGWAFGAFWVLLCARVSNSMRLSHSVDVQAS
jgi:membrane-associated phospholipid phosphatase